jgi:putative ABC transport system permease protein
VDADQVHVTAVQLPFGTYPTWGEVADTYGALVDRLADQPGVEAAGGSNVLPLEIGWRVPFGIVGEPPPARPEDALQSQVISVSEGYFESLGVRPRAGRFFTRLDTRDAVPVIVVNESFARRYLGGAATIGRQLSTEAVVMGPLGINLMRVPGSVGSTLNQSQIGPPRDFEVVGVVPDVRNAPLGQAVEPAIYFPARQFPFRELRLTVRATTPAVALAALRAALREVAPAVPIGQTETWGDRVARGAAEQRLLMVILIVFGGLAALLAAVGVYGLFSWTVALRTRELAIRVALGAPPAQISGLVVKQSAVLVLAGVGLGLATMLLAGRALSSVLYEISPADPISMAAAGTLLLLAALAACVPPALRAMRVDPVQGLRAE